MRISDWSSDVCSSDLHLQPLPWQLQLLTHVNGVYSPDPLVDTEAYSLGGPNTVRGFPSAEVRGDRGYFGSVTLRRPTFIGNTQWAGRVFVDAGKRSEEHTSELQSLMRNSYAVFCLKKKK